MRKNANRWVSIRWVTVFPLSNPAADLLNRVCSCYCSPLGMFEFGCGAEFPKLVFSIFWNFFFHFQDFKFTIDPNTGWLSTNKVRKPQNNKNFPIKNIKNAWKNLIYFHVWGLYRLSFARSFFFRSRHLWESRLMQYSTPFLLSSLPPFFGG